MELVNKFLVVGCDGEKEFVSIDEAVVFAKETLGNIYEIGNDSNVPMMSYC